MANWVSLASDYVIAIIDALALAVVAVGTAQAFVACMRVLFGPLQAGIELRTAFLRYARWLIAALTFQLAADIVESMGASSWEDVGRLGAIAFIRTFLNYFLERDIDEAREKNQRSLEPAKPGAT
jgi:uncharacterized membrane protein